LRLMKAKLLIETVVAAEPIKRNINFWRNKKIPKQKKRRQSKSIQESACNADWRRKDLQRYTAKKSQIQNA
jgi:hypothetical protein